MADISALGELKPVEGLDLNTYKDVAKPRGFKPLAPKGIYTLRAPDGFPAEAFGRTNKGTLKAQIDPTIVGGDNDGVVVKFQSVNASTYGTGKRVGSSSAGDYLRAFGVRGKIDNEQELADAIEATSNQLYQAELDWRARFPDGTEVKGMQNFPQDEEGRYIPFFENKDVVDEQGRHPRVWANLNIVRFIPKEDE